MKNKEEQHYMRLEKFDPFHAYYPKYVMSGDIIINRIGKNAGYWTKYSGEKQLVSDCLIVIRGGKQLEEFLTCHSVEGRLVVPIRGVATKYISISDLTSLYFEI